MWQSVGTDVENGFWAIIGARQGTYLTMLEDWWDYKNVQDFDVLEELWKEYESINDPIDHCKRLGETLRNKLNLPIVDMDPEESKFFKHHYKSVFRNKGVMERE